MHAAAIDALSNIPADEPVCCAQTVAHALARQMESDDTALQEPNKVYVHHLPYELVELLESSAQFMSVLELST